VPGAGPVPASRVRLLGMSAVSTGLACGIAGLMASSPRRLWIARPELASVLGAAGQLLATAEQQAIEGKRQTSEKNPADKSMRIPTGPQVNAVSGDIEVENLQHQ
jgi:hypothetical protein